MKLVWIFLMMQLEFNEQSQIHRENTRSIPYCEAQTILMEAEALRRVVVCPEMHSNLYTS